MANDFFRMVLWWCGMTEVLLFSDDEKIFNLTNSVIDGRYKLTWCTYKSLEKKLYPYTDIVIMYFDKEMVKKGTGKGEAGTKDTNPYADGRRNTAKYFFNVNGGRL